MLCRRVGCTNVQVRIDDTTYRIKQGAGGQGAGGRGQGAGGRGEVEGAGGRWRGQGGGVFS